MSASTVGPSSANVPSCMYQSWRGERMGWTRERRAMQKYRDWAERIALLNAGLWGDSHAGCAEIGDFAVRLLDGYIYKLSPIFGRAIPLIIKSLRTRSGSRASHGRPRSGIADKNVRHASWWRVVTVLWYTTSFTYSANQIGLYITVSLNMFA